MYFNKLDLNSIKLAYFAGKHPSSETDTIWTEAQRSIDSRPPASDSILISDNYFDNMMHASCEGRHRAWQAEHDGRQDEADAIWAELDKQYQSTYAVVMALAKA